MLLHLTFTIQQNAVAFTLSDNERQSVCMPIEIHDSIVVFNGIFQQVHVSKKLITGVFLKKDLTQIIYCVHSRRVIRIQKWGDFFIGSKHTRFFTKLSLVRKNCELLSKTCLNYKIRYVSVYILSCFCKNTKLL